MKNARKTKFLAFFSFDVFLAISEFENYRSKYRIEKTTGCGKAARMARKIEMSF